VLLTVGVNQLLDLPVLQPAKWRGARRIRRRTKIKRKRRRRIRIKIKEEKEVYSFKQRK
jgi:hypothetical protein